MVGSGWPGLLKALAAAVFILGAVSLALIYFIPSPPSTVVIATSQRGGGYEFLGQRYRAILERKGVKVELLHTGGSAANIKLLEDANSGVKIGFTQGGISNSEQAPNVMSLGRINYQPFWIFYRGTEKLDKIRQLSGASIAVGAEGSGTQVAAKQIFGLSDINPDNSRFSPLGGEPAVKALQEGTVDAAFLAYSANAPVIKSLFNDPNIQLMNLSQTEALTKILPYLVQLKLPQGVIHFGRSVPLTDVSLVGTTNAVIVRKDLHPQIIYLLLQAMVEEHKKAGLFERAEEFPTPVDSEFAVAESAVDFYKNGSSFLYRSLPFWMVTHVQRLIAVLLAGAAIAIPIFNFAPKLYQGFLQSRMRRLYRRLRVIENEMETQLTEAQVAALQSDFDNIVRMARVLPMRHSDLFFDFNRHIEATRTRLAKVKP
jgi:TRAP transporter TAXI family solute receptor